MSISIELSDGGSPTKADYDLVIIGGGQAALALAYYLRRSDLSYVIYDSEDGPGAAWRHGWQSLRLFSPAVYSSLPGWPMPPSAGKAFPSREEVIDYLARYEARYAIPVERPVRVRAVESTGTCLRLKLSDGRTKLARAVVSATGTWSAPFVPDYTGRLSFHGHQVHSAHYQGPGAFAGQRVLVVGGGNSGAQIQAELSEVAHSTWVTIDPPEFLPDDVDGHALFERATAKVTGNGASTQSGFGDIVMVPPVRAARDRGDLTSERPFLEMTSDGVVWPDGRHEPVDTIIWCTGFRPATDHLKPLGIVGQNGKVEVIDNQSAGEPRLWLAGYGNWTGAASATLIGSSRVSRSLVPRLVAFLEAKVSGV
ncbi:NAD(P)/FAD-dependent oxidoreductase [Roseibium denhamense]|uniref:Predicted flavoprotein CzcO associated with the cation diffusion facilitator CzcD n=1 Tax=Roseibium denhamense TaxID=76305 RepID=A0ABY1PH51_9HYPH|nr:ArsO family NAD(P)H-dependent flavin-containing monooxygenase [Roseibium denhamense]MTI04989.1 NAD(P)/FAD-dependent oxidoreductase [Roseibium denhamense]SMP33270.1 Predicted flavoprotein CzcO associated with the cation diffusion facilitator CzcD [Roseibium denhamense]